MLLQSTNPKGINKTLWQLLTRIINGQVSFGAIASSDGATIQPQNLDGFWLEAAFTVDANTDQTFNHGLGRVPFGYIPCAKSQAGDIFTGSSPATSTQITLQCTSTGGTMLLFLI